MDANELFVFAVHYFVIPTIVPRLCYIYLFVEPTVGFVTFWRFACFIIVTVVCEILAWILLKCIPGFYKVLTGNRVPK